jgi:hypothetical protein
MDEEDGKESTSISDNGESPNKIGEGGRERIGIVCRDSLFGEVLLFEVTLHGEERDTMGEHWYVWMRTMFSSNQWCS